MSAPDAGRQQAGRLLRILSAGLVVLALAGCGSASGPNPAPTQSTPIPSTSAPSTPADGIRLTVLGVTNGPDAFTVPRGSVLSTVVDQPNNVVLVWSTPDPTEVADYLREALPTSGFAVSEPVAGEPTFTFQGHGWAGSFTASGGSAAILLRPL